jgi:hypothetical protein
MAYVLYTPLYIAGPFTTFNDFMWQVSFLIYHLDSANLRICEASETTFRRDSPEGHVPRPICLLPSYHGVYPSLYVHSRHQRSKAWIGASPAEIAMIGFLEFDHRMAQGDHTMLHPSSIY